MRIPVSLDEIAPIAVSATIAAEDQRFREHSGVDLLAVASALTEAATVARAQPRGASTITQQLARRLYLSGTDAPALLRKAREALIALQLEARHSKHELIEAYLNHVYYGRGAYGIEAAARRYFGVGARQLDLAQASFVAGLPQLPSVYGEESAAARTRQRYVLDRLAADGVITPQQASSAARTPLAFADAGEPALAPHFTTMVDEELARLRPDLAGQPGLIIETTLDSALQREAARSLRAHLSRIRNRNAGNGAVVALDTASGALLALVGSADFSEERSGQVNMALAPRQPGSALKPFLYAAAFERGYTAATVLLDVPSSFLTPVGSYQPLNYDLRFRGPTPLRVALASSLNVPAVRTLDRIGVDALLEIADRAGLERPRRVRGPRTVADARLGRGTAARSDGRLRRAGRGRTSRRALRHRARTRDADGRASCSTNAREARASAWSPRSMPSCWRTSSAIRLRARRRSASARYWRRPSRRR